MLAHCLDLPNAGDQFLSKLFPSLSSSTTSEDISNALKRDTSKVLGNGVGLQSWRQITVAFSAAHKDPAAVNSHGIDPDNEIRGHSNVVAETNYANYPSHPSGISYDRLRSHLQAAHWWYDLVGMITSSTMLKLLLMVSDRHSKWRKPACKKHRRDPFDEETRSCRSSDYKTWGSS